MQVFCGCVLAFGSFGVQLHVWPYKDHAGKPIVQTGYENAKSVLDWVHVSSIAVGTEQNYLVTLRNLNTVLSLARNGLRRVDAIVVLAPTLRPPPPPAPAPPQREPQVSSPRTSEQRTSGRNVPTSAPRDKS